MKTTTTKSETSAVPATFFKGMTRPALYEWLQDNMESSQSCLKNLDAAARNGSLAYEEQNIEVASKRNIWAKVISWLSKEPALEVAEIKQNALTEALRYARYGHHSTSQISNICAAAEASAWAELVERCGGV